MSLTKTVYTDPNINPISELHTTILATAGWSVDKYVTDDELYINHTAEDGTIGYYSFKLTSPDTRSYRISCYCNLGFNAGDDYYEQPGVYTNSTPAVSNIYIDIGKNIDMKEFSIVIGSESILLHSKRLIGRLSVNEGYSAYLGILKKSTSYTGGNIAYGSHQTGISPEMIVYYEGTWYSNDGGVFIATEGVGAYFDKIAFSNNNMFNYNTRSIKLRHRGVYIETPTGVDTFEYVGGLQDTYFTTRNADICINSIIVTATDNYHIVPWSTPGGIQTVYAIPGA